MALDTTIGGPSADSYGELSAFKTYCASIGKDIAAISDADLEVHLRRATQYLTRSYEPFWRGYRTNETQSLPWPRRARPANVDFRSVQGFNGILDGDGFEVNINSIPAKVVTAQFEAAILLIDGFDLTPNLVRGGRVKSSSQKVGPITETTEWETGASARDRYTAIEGLLDAFVSGHPGASIASGRVVRA